MSAENGWLARDKRWRPIKIDWPILLSNVFKFTVGLPILLFITAFDLLSLMVWLIGNRIKGWIDFTYPPIAWENIKETWCAYGR